MQEIQRFFPHVVIPMGGGNELTSPTASPLGVASDIHELALSIAGIESCIKVLVGAIPPRVSYPSTATAYPERVEHCNHILRNLLDVEESFSYFKIRGGWSTRFARSTSKRVFTSRLMACTGYIEQSGVQCAWASPSWTD